MTEENATEQERPEPLKRYRIQLEGNRGETVMKLRESDLERYNVIGLADGEESEEPPQKKARTASNKARSSSNK